MTEREVKRFAAEAAETIVIRTDDNGNSTDTRRKSTAAEKKVISGLIAGALLAANSGYELQAAAATAEYSAHFLLNGANCYDSVYRPIMDGARK